MGIEKEFKRVKLLIGIIFKNPEKYNIVKQRLENFFSPVDLESDKIPFDSTTYYNEEMGFPLFRRFLSFKNLISPEDLPDIKIFTNNIELETANLNKRSINLDPGYLSEANVIIATTKNYYHRIPLQKGIYAHMEYVLKKNRVVPLDWTYPDFRKLEYIDFFSELKLLYKKNLALVQV